MKFYIASRMENKAAASELTEKLKTKGHTVTLDWTRLEKLKPYEQNSERSAEVADQMVKAVQNADLFVVFLDEGGTGLYTELGVALAMGKQVFVVGDLNKPIFLFHPLVTRVYSIQELEEKLVRNMQV